ncbi:MAG TPA: tetratricopeptide repeat protein, partial [Spirochaetes bacterium]|nr:tetratricopeptide repeat protein [Spirochaetota bacterium]
ASYHLKDWNSCQRYYLDALQAFNKLDNIHKLAEVSYNLGIVYYYHKEKERALKNFNKSLSWYQTIKNKYGISICEKRLGDIYYDNDDMNDALAYYSKCLKNLESVDLENYYDVHLKLKEIQKTMGQDSFKS